MVRVLLYGYCVGVRSSRELERACVDVVAFRWLAGQQAPDFRSIGRFRKRHLAALGNVFLQALKLCRATGLVSLGRVALDGTKFRANASRRKAMSYARLSEKQRILAAEVSDMLADAQSIDAAEDARFGANKRGDEFPPELADRQSRLVKMAAARKQLEEDAAEKARKAAEQKTRDRGDDDDTAAGKGEEAAATAEVRPGAQRNFTDPDSRIMKTADGSFHYCHNAQAVVDADYQVIVATEPNNTAVDAQQLVPMLAKTREINGSPGGQFLADAGYCWAGNLEHVASLKENRYRAERILPCHRPPQTRRAGPRRSPGTDPRPGHRAGADGQKTENEEWPGRLRPPQGHHRTGLRPDPHTTGQTRPPARDSNKPNTSQ